MTKDYHTQKSSHPYSSKNIKSLEFRLDSLFYKSLNLIPMPFILLVFLVMSDSKLHADRIVTSVLVDGSTQTTVTAGSSVNVDVNVTTTGYWPRWRSTRWILSDGQSGCVNHDNFNWSGAYSVNFNIDAPNALGDYNLSIGAYSDNSCWLGESEISTLVEAIHVDNVNSFTGTNYRDFSLLYGANLHGDMKIFGNTILGERQCLNWQWQWGGWGIGWIQVCASYANSTVCPAANTNNAEIQTRFWDVDGDASTFNSSSSQLIMPAGSVVKKAYLYWQGLAAINEFNSARTIKFKSPASDYITLEAPASQMNWSQYNSYYPYQAMIEITEQMNGAGEYVVADLTTTEGQIAGLGTYGAWSIVVVYENLENTMKNISIYDGYQAIDESNEQEITLSGFMTPTAGVVNSKFLVFTGEGDVDISGDYVEMDGTKLRRNDADGGDNAFNASVTDNGVGVATRSPSCQNNLGIDIHTYNVGTMGQNIIGNNQTNTTVKLGSSQDMYFPSVFAFSTELYVPDVCYEEYITKDGQTPDTIKVGDLLDIEVYITNKNFEPAKGVSIKRMFNTEYEYERNSTQVYEGGSFQAKTDAAGDDVVLYDEDEDFLLLNLGQGATADSGGIINLDQNETFAFQFTPGVDGNISSAYLVSYRDESGVNGPIEEFSNIPIGKCSNRDITETIIPVEPSGNARIVESGKNWSDFNGGLFTKVVGLGTTYDILFATDDSGATLSSGEITKIELVDIHQGASSVVETLHDGSMIVNQRATFAHTFDRAYQRVQFRLTLASGDMAFSNDFSVRPAEFSTTPLSLKAKEAYTLPEESLKATSYGSVDPASGYTRLLQVNHIDELLFDNTKICLNDTKDLLVGNINIEVTDGSSQDTSVVSFNDIGEFDLVFLDEGWIQSDDKQLSHCITDSTANTLDAAGRVGCGIGGSLHVNSQPFDLNVTNVTIIPSNDFRYIDTSLTQNVTITFDVHALKSDGAIAQNFDLQCYQTPVQIDDINFTINTDAPQQKVIYTFNGTPSNQASYTLAPNAPLFDFALGASQNNQFVYNFERLVSNPVNPLQVESFSASFSSGFATASLNQDINTSFVYGRIRPLDTITVSNSVQTPVEIEVFNSGASDFTDGMFEQSLDWYRNANHTNVAFGRILSGFASQPGGLLPMLSDSVTVTPGAITGGIQDLDLTATQPAPLWRTIHLQISPWLWFNTEGVDYNASVNSTCKTHPCLDFTYDDFTGREAIESGNFGGLDFEVDDLDENSSAVRKRGVKVFR